MERNIHSSGAILLSYGFSNGAIWSLEGVRICSWGSSRAKAVLAISMVYGSPKLTNKMLFFTVFLVLANLNLLHFSPLKGSNKDKGLRNPAL